MTGNSRPTSPSDFLVDHPPAALPVDHLPAAPGAPARTFEGKYQREESAAARRLFADFSRENDVLLARRRVDTAAEMQFTAQLQLENALTFGNPAFIDFAQRSLRVIDAMLKTSNAMLEAAKAELEAAKAELEAATAALG